MILNGKELKAVALARVGSHGKYGDGIFGARLVPGFLCIEYHDLNTNFPCTES